MPCVVRSSLAQSSRPSASVTVLDPLVSTLGEVGQNCPRHDGSAEEAVGLVERGLSPDMLVTDHLMPGMNGPDLARILQARYPQLPLVIVSGYTEGEDIAPDLKRLTKPFRCDELAASLAGLTGRE